MRSPNKFRLKYILECLYNVVMNPFTCIRGLESEKGRFVENTSPLSESVKNERNGSPMKSSFAFEQRLGQLRTVPLR